jgi:hypothetical protein
MPLNSSGQISLAGSTAGQSIAAELSLGPTTTITLNDTAVRTLAAVPSGTIAMPTDFWGKSTGPVGTAYWAVYAGYHFRPSPATSSGNYNTYSGANFHTIDSTGNLIVETLQDAYLAPSWSNTEFKFLKFNSSGVYTAQSNWGNSFPNRNTSGLYSRGNHTDRTKFIVHGYRPTGSFVGGTPTVQAWYDTNLNRTTYQTNLGPTNGTTIVDPSQNQIAYGPNNNYAWAGNAPTAASCNFAYGIRNSGYGMQSSNRLPVQTNANLSQGNNSPIVVDNSNNYYVVNTRSVPNFAVNWWKINSSGTPIGQSTIEYPGLTSAIITFPPMRMACNPTTGNQYFIFYTTTEGIIVTGVNSGGTVLWCTRLSEPSTGLSYERYNIHYDSTNNKVIIFLPHATHPVDGVVYYVIWLNAATGAITLQRKLRGQVNNITLEEDVYLDRMLLSVRSGVWNTGVNNPAPRGGTQLVINPTNVISLPAPGGALGAGVGYGNLLTYAVTTNFSNAPFTANYVSNGLSGWTSPGMGQPYSPGGYDTNTDYGIQLSASGSW